MATVIKDLSSFTRILEARLQKRLAIFKISDPRLREALFRVGFLIEAEAKINIQRGGRVDTGRLINSIKFKFFKEGKLQGIRVGSFGVPYARLHEFGGEFRDDMRRAMFWNMNRSGRPRRPSKGVAVGGTFKGVAGGRGFLRPAVKKHRGRLAKELVKLIREGT